MTRCVQQLSYHALLLQAGRVNTIGPIGNNSAQLSADSGDIATLFEQALNG